MTTRLLLCPTYLNHQTMNSPKNVIFITSSIPLAGDFSTFPPQKLANSIQIRIIGNWAFLQRRRRPFQEFGDNTTSASFNPSYLRSWLRFSSRSGMNPFVYPYQPCSNSAESDWTLDNVWLIMKMPWERKGIVQSACGMPLVGRIEDKQKLWLALAWPGPKWGGGHPCARNLVQSYICTVTRQMRMIHPSISNELVCPKHFGRRTSRSNQLWGEHKTWPQWSLVGLGGLHSWWTLACLPTPQSIKPSPFFPIRHSPLESVVKSSSEVSVRCLLKITDDDPVQECRFLPTQNYPKPLNLAFYWPVTLILPQAAELERCFATKTWRNRDRQANTEIRRHLRGTVTPLAKILKKGSRDRPWACGLRWASSHFHCFGCQQDSFGNPEWEMQIRVK